MFPERSPSPALTPTPPAPPTLYATEAPPTPSPRAPEPLPIAPVARRVSESERKQDIPVGVVTPVTGLICILNVILVPAGNLRLYGLKMGIPESCVCDMQHL